MSQSVSDKVSYIEASLLKSVDLNIKLEADKYQKTTIHLYAASWKGEN